MQTGVAAQRKFDLPELGEKRIRGTLPRCDRGAFTRERPAMAAAKTWCSVQGGPHEFKNQALCFAIGISRGNQAQRRQDADLFSRATVARSDFSLAEYGPSVARPGVCFLL